MFREPRPSTSIQHRRSAGTACIPGRQHASRRHRDTPMPANVHNKARQHRIVFSWRAASHSSVHCSSQCSGCSSTGRGLVTPLPLSDDQHDTTHTQWWGTYEQRSSRGLERGGKVDQTSKPRQRAIVNAAWRRVATRSSCRRTCTTECSGGGECCTKHGCDTGCCGHAIDVAAITSRWRTAGFSCKGLDNTAPAHPVHRARCTRGNSCRRWDVTCCGAHSTTQGHCRLHSCKPTLRHSTAGQGHGIIGENGVAQTAIAAYDVLRCGKNVCKARSSTRHGTATTAGPT